MNKGHWEMNKDKQCDHMQVFGFFESVFEAHFTSTHI